MKTVKKIVAYFSLGDRNLSLEHRLFLSSILIGLAISIIGSIMVMILSLSLFPIIISLIISCFLLVVCYFARFKGIIGPFILPVILVSFVGIFAIWLAAGGIKGPNILPSSVILIFALLIVSVNYRLHVFLLYLTGVITVYLLQYFQPEIIVDYPNETARWIDSFVTTIYCSICIYLIINFIHKHYTFDKNLDLQKITERLRLATRAANIGIWDWNVEKDELLWDDSMYELYGISRKDFGGAYEAWAHAIHPDDKADTEAAIEAALTGKREYAAEFRIVWPNGSIHYIYASGQTFHAPDGKPIRMVGINYDITERKEAEKILKENESRFRAFIEQSPVAIGLFNLEGIGLYANQTFLKLASLNSLEEMIGKPAYEYFAPKFQEESKERTRRRVLGLPVPTEFESVFSRSDGSEFPVQLAVAPIQLSTGIANIVFLFDISERKQAMEFLRTSEERYRSLIDNLEAGVVVHAPDTSILLNNYRASLILGLSNDQLRGKAALDPAWEFVNIDDSSMAVEDFPVSRIVKDKKSIKNQIVGIHHPGKKEVVWVLVNGFPVLNMAGGITEIIISFIDITERLQAERALIKAKEKAEESDRLKSAFLANMSHEIRTPMNGILGFSDLLKEPGLSGEEQQEYIKIIEKSGARMLNIISEIMDISKIESGQMDVTLQETNISEQIKDVYKLLQPEADRKEIDLIYKSNLSLEEASVLTDRNKLDSILTNLVKNAIKYTSEGSIAFGCERAENAYLFYVKDTGIGIPKERQEAIFERFIQADLQDIQARQGAGLGLSIAKAFVEMLGGSIWVESEVGMGSKFYFTLPYSTKPSVNLSDKGESSYPESLNANSPSEHQLKILIAEDDETSGLLLSILLKDISIEIIQTTNGIKAVEICRNHPDIDLVFMDINMPEMGGYEATRQIRQFNRDVVIIAQTAYALVGDRELSMKAGCNDYLSKPISSRDLQSLTMKYFKKK